MLNRTTEVVRDTKEYRDAIQRLSEATITRSSHAPMLQGINYRLQGQSRRSRFLIALALTCFVAALDLLSGPDLSLSLFYLLPIGGLAWYDGRPTARALTILSALWWLADGLWGALHPGIAFWNAVIRLGFFLCVVLLIAQLRQAYLEQQTLAERDPLTGLANLRALSAALGQQLTPGRLPAEALTIAYLDLDNFKQVNDRFGHAAGDEALHTVATAIRTTLRTSDISARIGGDEFVVVLAGCDQLRAQEVLERLRDVVHRRSDAETWGISVSIGAVCLAQPPGPALLDVILQRADAMMYQAKLSGKNRIVVEAW